MEDDDGFAGHYCPFWWEEIVLDEEDAAFLEALMAAPPGSPGKLNFVPVAIPEGDASLIR